MFADELNKSKLVRDMLGGVNPKSMHILHSAVQMTWVRTLYSHFPTVLNFGKYFYLFTRHQSTIDLCKIDVFNERMREKAKIKKPRKADSNAAKLSAYLKKVNR